jgi:molecular chaperone DnaK
MPPEQKEMAQKQVDELKQLLTDQKWDELKQKLDQFDAMAQQFSQQQGGGNDNEPQPEQN